MAEPALKITVLRDRYQTEFNTPRLTRHDLKRVSFLPFNYLNPSFDGFTLMRPRIGTDLVHVMNRVPLISGKFIISHESGVPRRYGMPRDSAIVKAIQARIESNKCRRIIGMSHFANRNLIQNQTERGRLEHVEHKFMVRHPSVMLGPDEDRLSLDKTDGLVLTFLGAHFARKGGCVAVRIAEIAHEKNIPIYVNIVSSLEVGGRIWTDPVQDGYFERYLKLLDLPNVTSFGALPNVEARALLGRSHFCLLPTFADTFGFSVIEAMAEHTPSIVTDICALPEFTKDGYNAIVLHLDRNGIGDWAGPPHADRNKAYYAKVFTEEVERLASTAVVRLEHYLNHPYEMKALRRNARKVAETMFSAPIASEKWDTLYDRVSTEDVRSEVLLAQVLDASSPKSVEIGMALC